MRAIAIKRLADRLRGALLATLIVALAAGSLAPGALAGTLDQQQTVSSSVFFTDADSSSAQTFTAGLSGGLDQVDLYLDRQGVPNAPLSVEIRDAPGGPGSAILAGQSVPVSSVPAGDPGFLSIRFAAPAPVAAGTQYAIVAHRLSAPMTATTYDWWGSNANPYAGGAEFFTPGPPSGPWTAFPGHDAAFKTYVVPNVVPAPGPTGQRAAALRKCRKKLKKNHKKTKFKKCRKKAKRLPV
ncbi:MAG TPA: choice-of-anchor R domain-containing protein [Solirubrobacterales bacterium]